MIERLRIPRGILLAVAVLAVAGIVAVYFTLDPSTYFFPRCMFHELTGWQCPGCGSQRAFHSLLNGDFHAAWHYNALFVLEIPLLALLAVAWWLRDRVPSLSRVLNSQSVILVILTIIILWTIFRNIPWADLT